MTLPKFLQKLFKLTQKIDKIVELAAYHESEHIALAYFYGYSCDSVELIISDPGNAKTKLNYNGDLLLITSITNCKTDSSFFNSLDKSLKARSPQVADCHATVLLAGSVAEATILNDSKVDGNMEVEISFPDLEKVDNIHFFLSNIDKAHDPNYIKTKLMQTLSLMKKKGD